MVCELDVAKLRGRGQEISKILLPITGSRRVSWSAAPQRNEFVIAVHSGSKPDAAPRDWRFSTTVRMIRGSYFERWVPTSETRRSYYLAQAYLHLYWRERGSDAESEFLALHCDPNEPDDTGPRRHAQYKRGPHIHVVAATHPLPHAHLALNVGHLAEVLSSVDGLTTAVSSGVNLIRYQVLDLFAINGV